jgi:hypothetical protein
MGKFTINADLTINHADFSIATFNYQGLSGW